MTNNPYKFQKLSGKLGKNLERSIHQKYTPKEEIVKQKVRPEDLRNNSPSYMKNTETPHMREYVTASRFSKQEQNEGDTQGRGAELGEKKKVKNTKKKKQSKKNKKNLKN